MKPTAEAVGKFALKLERRANEFGWDRPPLTLALFGEGGRLVGKVMPIEVPDGAQLPEFLQYIGQMMVRYPFHPAGLAAKLTAQAGDFAGYCLMHEVWINSSMAPEEARRPDRPMLADIVGTKEARVVYVADCAGRFTMALRHRGEGCTVSQSDDGKFTRQGGRISVALRDMVLGTAQCCDPVTVDMEAIKNMLPELPFGLDKLSR